MMKKFKILILIAILSIITFKPLSVAALDNFEILDLDVSIKVNDDGAYDVVENYKMNFFSPALGFYRDLASVHKMRFNVDGHNVDKVYQFPITDIELVGDVYTVESQFNGKQIIVGPDSGPRFTGIRDYQISYKIHTQPFNVAEQDEVFFQNLVSDWSATIHNFSSTVTFENPVDLSNLIVKGDSASGNIEPNCQLLKNGFSCSYPNSFRLTTGKGITAQLPLSKDYFKRPLANIYYIYGFIASGVVLALAITLKSLYAQETPIIEKIGFNPPQGFNSAMVGYVIDDVVDNEDIYSLLFYWANQGLITIKEESKDKLVFRKNREIAADALFFEKNIFNLMFYKDGDITTADWQKRDLYTKLMMAKNEIKQSVNNQGTLYDDKAKRFKSLTVIIATIILSSFYFFIYRFNYKEFSNSIIVTIVSAAIIMFGFVLFEQSNKENIRAQKKHFSSFLLAIVFGGVIAAVIKSVLYFAQGLNIATIPFGLITIITFIGFNFASRMKVRSQYGANIYGEIIGLKTFIQYAKADELLMMQAENPFLYFDVLPYAYAFNMSDLWSEHFKSIEIPNSPYYTSYRSPGYTNYLMMRSLSQSVHAVNMQMLPKVQVSRGGGSFSSGGGFSGGGFSGGGGFGGGGGGGR